MKVLPSQLPVRRRHRGRRARLDDLTSGARSRVSDLATTARDVALRRQRRRDRRNRLIAAGAALGTAVLVGLATLLLARRRRHRAGSDEDETGSEPEERHDGHQDHRSGGRADQQARAVNAASNV